MTADREKRELIVLEVDKTYRPSASWAGTLDGKRKAFAKHRPSEDKIGELEREWTTAFVRAEFILEGRPLSESDIIERTDPTAASKTSLALADYATGLADAFRVTLGRARKKEGALLDTQSLKELHWLVAAALDPAAGTYRSHGGTKLLPDHDPVSPALVPAMLQLTVDWTEEPGFHELHPVERAVLMHTRLLDLQPFSTENATIARLVASSLTVRAGYPPVLLTGSDASRYAEAVARALLMQTQPCVELFAESLGRTLDQAIRILNE